MRNIHYTPHNLLRGKRLDACCRKQGLVNKTNPYNPSLTQLQRRDNQPNT